MRYMKVKKYTGERLGSKRVKTIKKKYNETRTNRI